MNANTLCSPPPHIASLHGQQVGFLNKIKETSTLDTLDQVYRDYFGKKGLIKQWACLLATLPRDEKPRYGSLINTSKEVALEAFEHQRLKLTCDEGISRVCHKDLCDDSSLPVELFGQGRLHPLTQTRYEIIEFFQQHGLQHVTGPEIEDDFHNFEALNFMPHHPARTTHDTFYLDLPGKQLLRTHTSPVQIRTLKRKGAPARILSTGRVYRSDHDQTHTPMFHQIEALVIDKGIGLSEMKWLLNSFFTSFFNTSITLRFRPSFFPFTEPSAEVDLAYRLTPQGLQLGQGDKWLEVLGCGQVHPNVLRTCGVNPDVWSGFAFGMGLERLSMLKYGLTDLRQFFDNDQRWLARYGFPPFSIGA